jgi:hypothetical protein
MCRACRSARAASARRPSTAAFFLAPLLAGLIAATCLAFGIHGPLGATSGGANLVFWIVAGMGVGLFVRIVTRSSDVNRDSTST